MASPEYPCGLRLRRAAAGLGGALRREPRRAGRGGARRRPAAARRRRRRRAAPGAVAGGRPARTRRRCRGPAGFPGRPSRGRRRRGAGPPRRLFGGGGQRRRRAGVQDRHPPRPVPDGCRRLVPAALRPAPRQPGRCAGGGRGGAGGRIFAATGSSIWLRAATGPWRSWCWPSPAEAVRRALPAGVPGRPGSPRRSPEEGRRGSVLGAGSGGRRSQRRRRTVPRSGSRSASTARTRTRRLRSWRAVSPEP